MLKRQSEGEIFPENAGKLAKVDKVIREGSFTVTVETDPKTLESRIQSELQFIGNIPWRLYVETAERQEGKELEIYLWCGHKQEDPFWKVEVDQTIRLISQKEEVEDVVRKGSIFFDSIDSSNGYPFVSYEDLMNPKNGYNKSFKIQVLLEIKNVIGIPGYEINFAKPTYLSDIVLVVEGKRVHVNKTYLAMYSSVFLKMFFSKSADKNMKEVEMKNLKHDEFIDLLGILYPETKVEIHENNYGHLLQLADQFDIEYVIQCCGKFLKSAEDFDAIRRFKIAEKYNLTEVYQKVIKQLTREDIQALRKCDEFKYFKVSSKEALIDRLLKL